MSSTHPNIQLFSTIRSIFSHLHEIRRHRIRIGFLMILYILTIVSEPYFYKILMDRISFEIADPVGEIPSIVIGIIILWIILSILTIVSRYIFTNYLLRLQHEDWTNFIMYCIKKMICLPTNYHISVQHGEKQKIIDQGGEAIWEVGDNLIGVVMPQVIITFVLIIMGCFVDVRMTLLSLVLLPLNIIGVVFIGTKARSHQRAANTYWDQFYGRISDTFTNLNVIRIFGRTDRELTILHDRLEKAGIEQNDVRKLWTGFNSFGQAFSFVASVFTFSGGIILMYQGQITLGTIFFFLSFVERIYGPIFTVFRAYQSTMIEISHYEKLQEIFKMDEEKDEGTQILSGVLEGIRYENVSFHYPKNERLVLTDISLEVKKGQHVALVGHTGSGKSTIVQLLTRFYEPSDGRIFIDNTDIREFSLESYRTRFAAVFQDTTLFNDTIENNLLYVRDNLTHEDIERACREANIADFIESLPDKWETMVGERGLKLSGGEKQRIAIARAILADPDILILDEATSALDIKTERLVQEAFDRLMQHRTSIVIAHRLSTIIHADTIYFLEKGHIIASGTHQKLYKKSEKYRELVDMQRDGILFTDEEDEDTEEYDKNPAL